MEHRSFSHQFCIPLTPWWNDHFKFSLSKSTLSLWLPVWILFSPWSMSLGSVHDKLIKWINRHNLCIIHISNNLNCCDKRVKKNNSEKYIPIHSNTINKIFTKKNWTENLKSTYCYLLITKISQMRWTKSTSWDLISYNHISMIKLRQE